jgi:hypothetical protein
VEAIKALFPVGTSITLAPGDGTSYSFTYRDYKTRETLVENSWASDNAAGNRGNITGVSACLARHCR